MAKTPKTKKAKWNAQSCYDRRNSGRGRAGMGYNDLDKVDPLQHAEKMSPARTPPTFIAVSEADGYAGSGVAYFAALAKAKVPAALHVYPGGKHGTGMQEYPLSRWGDEAAQWMRDLKIIPEKQVSSSK